VGPSIVGTVFLIHQNQLITNYMPGMDDDNLDLINYESVFVLDPYVILLVIGNENSTFFKEIPVNSIYDYSYTMKACYFCFETMRSLYIYDSFVS
jgi:hypothetical protein